MSKCFFFHIFSIKIFEILSYDNNINIFLQVAAVKGISQVVLSRIIMAMPGMTILPIIFERLEKQKWLRNNPRLNAPLQTFGCGLFLIFMTPIACSIFDQTW